MRGGGTWALLYPSEFAYANGAEVLKDGKVVINSKEAVDALAWYLPDRAGYSASAQNLMRRGYLL